MKAHFKRFDDGLTLRVSGLGKTKRDLLKKAIERVLDKNGCETPTVTTFDDPLPECAPTEPNCGS